MPTVITPEGPLFETGAILVRLAEMHPEAGLIPAAADPRRPRYWQWHFYLASFFQREAFIQSVPGLFLPDNEAAQKELLEVSMARLRGNWKTLNDAIGAGPYILGDAYTTCDIAFSMQALWDECHPPEGLGAYPNALACLRRTLQRPAAQAVLKAHAPSAWRRFADLKVLRIKGHNEPRRRC